MQVKKRYLALPLAALALPLAGCLSASNGLNYDRSNYQPGATPYVASMGGNPPGMSGWPTHQLPIPGEPVGYTPDPVKPKPPAPPAPPAPPPCELPGAGQPITLDGCKQNDVLILRGVNFDFDKATLTAEAKGILDQVGAALQARPDIKVEIDGHTDGKGSVSYNQKLSERRAASVKAYLVGKGVAAERMTTAGFGKSRPIADNKTDEGRALNRRVELKVTEASATAAPVVTTDAPTASATVAPAGAAVTIVKFSFDPETITVPAGSTVTWTNQDMDTPHTVKFADGMSGTLKQGASYSKTFRTPGTYTYQCGVHPYMKGTVIVK
ncbi:MAG TPA: OmpA family protein [Nevskia sp.]|jgi:OOP family OmpA-OmpF porin|nr:OmpA family protein [Nevskia sp.]